MTYGYELEFLRASLKSLAEKYHIKYYDLSSSLDYKDFALKSECNITEFGCGGELISPIYNDKNVEICKKELKEKLYILKSEKAYIKKNSEKTGFHIHIGTDIFEDDWERKIYFFKFLKAFQNEIFDFAKGEEEQLRSCASICAGRLTKNIVEEIIKKGIYNTTILSKFYCVRFSKYNTVELRYFNASLQYDILVSYLLFVLRLGSIWKNKQYDKEVIDFFYKKEDQKISKKRILVLKDMFC